MTRARCFALAALIGACCLGPAPVFAQSGMPAGAPGQHFNEAGSPYQMPTAGDDCPWYGCPDEAPAACGIKGPPATWGGFLRAEYLHWNLRDPGNVLLGSPVAGVTEPRSEFVVFTPNTPSPLAVTRIPSTSQVNLSDVNGVRVTGGLDLFYEGSVEVSAFFLAQKNAGFLLRNFGTEIVDIGGFPFLLPITVGTSTLVNGQVGDNILLYNQSYGLSYVSQMWGGEANFLSDYDREGLLQFRPMAGVRYISLHEKMTINGVFHDPLVVTPDIHTVIESTTFNNLYGPQFGGRAEVVTKHLEFGADLKLLFLGNTMLAGVQTTNLRSNLDPAVGTDDTTTSFSFGTDINTWAQINFTQNFTVRVGYTFMWINRVTRPEDNIYWNDNGPLPNPPGVVVKLTKHDFSVHGVSIGAEFRF